MTTDQMTQDEVRAFARKMQSFDDQLTDSERSLFRGILRCAAESAGSEVTGYAMATGSPMDYRRVESFMEDFELGDGTRFTSQVPGPK